MISLRRPVKPLLFLFGAFCFAAALHACAAIGVAHADPVGGATAPPAVVAGIDWQAIMAVVSLVVAGIAVLLGGASMVLHAIAPRTKTTLDDRAAAGVDAIRLDIAKLASAFQSLGFPAASAPAPSPVTVSVTNHTVPSDPPPTVTTTPVGAGPVAALLIALLLGTVALQPACGVPATAGHAIVDCTKADKGALEAATVRLLSAPSWAALEAEAIAAGETIGGCALLAVITSYHPPTVASAAPVPPVDTHALVERVRAHFGGVTWVTTQGVQ